ncbi:hypothetical protein D9Q98_006961 [Chlorella vulgaris]|uniref:carotenoid 9,10-dioxygenase n=1 Tax=Chlorella vulgaris TaxID=3077 RepID=A0A9D4TJD2_CHLVU|nr:hypothetical protein D9Q98_006961 [Chlorella vulgaris]
MSTDHQPSLLARTGGAALTLASRTLHWLDGSSKERWGSEYLEGPFAPVDDEACEELEVEGSLPPDFRGTFIRNGPNPKLPPLGGYHWFDGDGMVHAVTFHGGGKATYCNRWVKTARLAQEQDIGAPLTVKFGDSRGKAALAHMAVARVAKMLGLLSEENGKGRGNTALVFHANRLLALHESDLPYALRIACNGLIETLGRVTFGGKVQHAFTAHPKKDPETGELFYIGYSVQQAPYCWYGRLDAQGRVVADFPVPLKEPVMMHDMALTQRHAILLDTPLLFDPKRMVKEGALPFTFTDRPLRIGVLPRYAESADGVRWFETENAMVFHVANAWEEGSTIRLFLCSLKHFSLSEMRPGPESLPYLSEVTINLEAGTCSPLRRLCALPADFPVVPASLVGRPTRFAYLATMGESEAGVPVFDGLAKVDLLAPGTDAGMVGVLKHGRGRLGGEAYFVPRSGNDQPINGKGLQEDDGYLMTFVIDEESGESELVVYDAKQISDVPVARARARRSLVVRASTEPKPTENAGTYMFKGKQYTEAEWKKAIADGTVNQAAPTPPEVTAEAVAAGFSGSAGQPSIGQLMRFDGPAPELINGRLAMLAFVAAVGAELSSGESVLRQFVMEPTGILLVSITFIAASLIPLLSNTKREAFSFFTPSAEMINGRAAMIGFASLLALEAARGAALF